MARHYLEEIRTWLLNPRNELCINSNLFILNEPRQANFCLRQILTAHAQPFRGARDLAFCLKVPLDSLLVCASSGGSGETARMRRLAWTFAARIGDKYQIRLTRSKFNLAVGCILSTSYLLHSFTPLLYKDSHKSFPNLFSILCI